MWRWVSSAARVSTARVFSALFRDGGGRAQQLIALRHRVADEFERTAFGVRGAVGEQRLGADRRFAQGFDELGYALCGDVGGLLDGIRIPGEARGKLGRPGGACYHGGLEAPQTGIGDLVEASRFACQSRRGLIGGLALRFQHILERFGFLVQPREQFVHRGPLAFLARKHELRARRDSLRRAVSICLA